MARALLGKFDGVKNWGEYADALRDCASDILAQLASDEILRIPDRAEFEAEDTAADRAGATMMAMDYRIGMMEAKYYLTLMTGLFGAYVGASKQDPRSVAVQIAATNKLIESQSQQIRQLKGEMLAKADEVKGAVKPPLSWEMLKTPDGGPPPKATAWIRRRLEIERKTGRKINVSKIQQDLVMAWRGPGMYPDHGAPASAQTIRDWINEEIESLPSGLKVEKRSPK